MEMDVQDIEVPILRRRKRESQKHLLVNSMVLSVIVSLILHLVVLFVLDDMKFPSLKGEQVTVKPRAPEDWLFPISIEPQPSASKWNKQGHARKPWPNHKTFDGMPKETVNVKGLEADFQGAVTPLVEKKEFLVPSEDLDKAFKRIRLTGVDVEGKTPEVPKIVSATLPKMAAMLPDTSMLLDIPDVPDARLNAPVIKESGIEAPSVDGMKGRVAVKPVVLPETMTDSVWNIAVDRNVGSGDALKTMAASGGIQFPAPDGAGKLSGGSGLGGVAHKKSVTYGVKVQLGDGITFGTPGDDDSEVLGGVPYQPVISLDQDLLEEVRREEGGEAIEGSMPLDEFVDIQVKVMREGDGSGYYQALIKPNESSAGLNDVAKDVLFIIDRSGSIREARLRQFRKATLEALPYLNPGDRYDVVTFSNEPEVLFGKFVSVTPENVERTRRHLNHLVSTGTTDVFGGIGPFVKQSNGAKERPLIVFMMSDGQSTISVHRGEVEVDNRKSNAVLKAIATANPGNVSIYPFSAGNDTNRMLMDFMARLNGGMPWHAVRGNSFSNELVQYMRTHTSLIVRNFRYIAEGRLAEDIFPKTLPHLYRNESLAVYGKFGAADEELVLTLYGYDAQGKLRNLIFRKKFADCEEVENDALEQGAVSLKEQWTAQKTLHLLAKWVIDYDSVTANGQEAKRRRQELNRLLGTITAFSKYSELLQ